MSRKFQGPTDRRRVINWLEDNLKYYKENIGGITEYRTLITQKLIDGVEKRIAELEKKEQRREMAWTEPA